MMAADAPSLTAHPIGPDEVGAVRAILLAAAEDLTGHYGSGHWSRVHALQTLRRHQAQRAVLLIHAGSKAVATLTLGRKKVPFYHNDWFANPKAPAVYLTDMAVLPAFQRQGIGTWSLQ
jgi:GNAT superfamily N-acetyltransferase